MQAQGARIADGVQASIWGDHSFLSGPIGGILAGCGIGVATGAAAAIVQATGYSLPSACIATLLLQFGIDLAVKKVTAKELWNTKAEMIELKENRMNYSQICQNDGFQEWVIGTALDLRAYKATKPEKRM